MLVLLRVEFQQFSFGSTRDENKVTCMHEKDIRGMQCHDYFSKEKMYRGGFFHCCPCQGLKARLVNGEEEGGNCWREEIDK